MKNKIIFKTLMLKGEAGSTIVSMEKTGHVGTADIYTITFNDGSTTEISLENMSAITSVEKTSSTDTEDIYTITCADGSTQTFSVLNHNADIAAMSDDIDTIDARVDNFINSVVPNTVETLWTGSIKDVGDSATLSKAVSNFDYIDLYLLGSSDSKYIRVPATQTAVEIQQQNLSDDASSNFLRLWEMGVSISGSTVSITKSIAWAWDDPNNSNPTVTANAQNSIPITRIDGVKVASDTPAEVTDIRVGADGTTYNSAGAAVRGQISDLKNTLNQIIDSNVLFESASETVNGSTWALKNIDVDAPIVVGDDYTVLIDSIEGGTAPHLCYIRCMDSSDQAIANVGTGTVTQNIKGTITAVENTAYIRVTLYASTTTTLPTGSATYTNVRVVHGTKEDVRIKDGNYTVTVGATNSDYTSLLKALKSTDDNVRIHVKAGTYNIWDEYISEYGQNFWSNYNGYSGNSDKFMRGLWLGNGRTIEFDELAKVVFTPNSEDVTDAIQDNFSVFATSSNNTIINANVQFADCRYAVHDDYAEKSGKNIFSHCTFDGAAHFGATIGGGCGKDNVYIFEDCLFLNNVNYYYDINYHNNNGLGATSGKNKIIVKNCYGVGRVRFKWYGSFTDISECIVSGSRFNKIDCVAHESEPNSIENMALYQFNNTVDIT